MATEHCVAKQDDEPSAAALVWAARQPADSTAAQAISGLGVEMVAAAVHGRRSLKTPQEPATKHTDCPGATKMGYNTTVTGAPAFETALQDQIEVLKDLERQSKEKAERLEEARRGIAGVLVAMDPTTRCPTPRSSPDLAQERRSRTEKLLGLRTDEARLSKELEVVKFNMK